MKDGHIIREELKFRGGCLKKQFIIPCNFTERVAVEVVQGISIIPGAPLYGTKDNRKVNFNSLLGVLSLNIKEGDIIMLESEDANKVSAFENILFMRNK